MWRWFLFLSLTLGLALAALDYRHLDDSSRSARLLQCEMNPTDCTCGYHVPSRTCRYDLKTCQCSWIYLARDADAKSAPPLPTNVTSSARLATTTTCHVDTSTCQCGFELVYVPENDLSDTPPTLAACFTRSSTCECGWDNGSGTYDFVPNKPNILASDTCVTDYATCSCLAGSYVVVPELTTTLLGNLANVKALLLAIQATLATLVPASQRMVVEPRGVLTALPVEQRQMMITESVAVMTRLKDLAGGVEDLGRLDDAESGSLASQLRGEIEYLGKLSDDENLLAAQFGETEQSIAARLRRMVTKLEGVRSGVE